MIEGALPRCCRRLIRISLSIAYLSRMRTSAFEPCIPSRGTTVPAGNDWIHEIKLRLIVRRSKITSEKQNYQM